MGVTAEQLRGLLKNVREASERAEAMLDDGDADKWTRACGEWRDAQDALTNAMLATPEVVDAYARRAELVQVMHTTRELADALDAFAAGSHHMVDCKQPRSETLRSAAAALRALGDAHAERTEPPAVVRRQGMEEAAKICELFAEQTGSTKYADAAMHCARRIREAAGDAG